MLKTPDVEGNFRIFSIDPGTDTLGLAVIEIDVIEETVTLIHAQTLKGKIGVKEYSDYARVFGDRRAKYRYNKERLEKLLLHFKPQVIISESPYMGKFALAFEALVQVLETIRQTIYEYDKSIQLKTIDPSSVKKAVNAPGKTKKGGQKDLVLKGLLGLKNLKNATGWPIESYDEHAIDAIAVGCYQVNVYYPNLLK